MSDPTNDLPHGRLRRLEVWIHQHRVRLLTFAVVVMFVTSLATAYLGFRAQQDRDADFQQFLGESAERRSQSCTADEREHLANVDNLKRTYLALESPTTRAQLGQGLVRLIVSQMSQAELKARTDQAPDFCDEPGVGLPEPDPVPPKRKDFSDLLAPSNQP